MKKSSFKNVPESRKLRIESLESRALLSVSAAEFAAIGAAYPDLDLPDASSDVNIIEIQASELSAATLNAAIETAGTTTADDLIVVRTTDEANAVVYSNADDALSVSIAAGSYGSVKIVAYGDQPLTINANELSRVATVASGTTAMFANVTFTGGKDANGGGINNAGKLTLINSMIKGNTATDSGGGIHSSGALTVFNSSFSGNSAKSGGGVYSSGTTTFTNSSLRKNSASTNGGGIYLTGLANSATLSYSTVVENTAENGGGVYVYGSGNPPRLNVYNSVISANVATTNGGGVYNGSGGTVVFKNATIAGNAALNGAGGGIYRYSGTVSAYNSILATNYATGVGATLSGALSSDSSGNVLDYNVFVNAPVFNTSGELVNADAYDLHLRSDSVAVDAGQRASSAGFLVDLDGNARFYGASVDAGAYEYQGDRQDSYEYSAVVNTLEDSFDLTDDKWSLREALYFAPEYVTITFAENLSGSIHLTLGQLGVNKAATIDGDNRITLDANQKTRVLYVCAGSETAPVVLTGLTLQNGKLSSESGAGVYHQYGVLNIQDCTISNNTTSNNGGGVYSAGALTVVNSTFSGNSATNSGGGVYADHNTLAMVNSVVCQNSAGTGGGIYGDYSTTTVTDSLINKNIASSNGAGFYGYYGTASFNNVSFEENAAASAGGGVYRSGGATTFTNSSLKKNSASTNGGGIYLAGSATLSYSTVVENTAENGGGIYAYNSNLNVNNSVISANVATINGGGVYNGSQYSNSGTVVFKNATIAGNAALNGAGGGIYRYSGTVSAYNSILATNYATGVGATLYGALSSDSSGNVLDYNVFVNAPVFNTSGKLINADAYDLHLRSDSVAVDAGLRTNSAGFLVDLDGNTRFYGDSVDAGAYEYQGDRQDSYEYSAVVNTLEDSFDLTDDKWSLREALYFAPEYVTITFAENLSGTIYLTLGQLGVNKAATIDGDNRITLDASQKTRVLYVCAGSETAPVVLTGLTLQNGRLSTGYGAGVYQQYGVLTIQDCTISNNTTSSNGGGVNVVGGATTISDSEIKGNSAGTGGGVYSSQNLTITNTTVFGNSATNSGGGIYAKQNTLAIVNSVICQNSAEYGGGIYGYSSTTTVTDSTINKNIASSDGAGFYGDNGTASFNNASFEENAAASAGGGVYCSRCTTIITGSSLRKNIASKAGGGIYLTGPANSAILSYSTVVENTAENGGGVYVFDYGNPPRLNVYNSVISANVATTNGGGVYNGSGGTVVFKNATIAGNAALNGAGGGIYTSGTVSACNTILAANTAKTNPDYSTTSQFVGSNNLSTYDNWNGSANLVFDESLPLFKNANGGDYRLATNSQAIDRGNNLYAETNYDLDGNPRIINETVDIGAYEAALDDVSPEPNSPVVNSLADVIDSTDLVVTLREAIEVYGNPGDTITFDPALAGGVIKLNAELVIDKAISIDASALYDAKNNAPGLTLDGAHNSRVLHISAGTKEAPVALTGLAILNGAAEIGAGVCVEGGAIAVSKSVIADSVASRYGGGLYVDKGYVSVSYSAISGNDASRYGGGVYADSSEVVVANSLIVDNAANRSGGGVFNDSGAIVFYNATISGNFATRSGGALHNDSGDATAYNTILAANVAGSNVDVWTSETLAGICNLSSYDEWEGEGNLVYNADQPLFENQSEGDYRLVEGSQAVDRGSNEHVVVQYDFAGFCRVCGNAVDIGAYELPENELSVDAYDASTRVVTISWLDMPGAVGYTVKLSKDGGDTWINYSEDVTALEKTVGGIYAGKTYEFQIFGVNAAGETLDTVWNGRFAPIAITNSLAYYEANQTIVINVTPAGDGSADLRWYYATPDGDVEIEEAAGMLEYTPTTSVYNIRVVATGTGDSTNSSAELTVQCEPTVGELSLRTYNKGSHQAIMEWEPLAGAVKYVFKISKNGGATWTTYDKNFTNAFKSVNGVYAGKSYSFRVYGIDASGKTLPSYYEDTIAPISLTTANRAYSVNKERTITLTGSADASADVRWYRIADEGDVEIEEARGLYSYTPTNGDYELRVVATGTGCSEGFSSSVSIARPTQKIKFSNYASNKATLTWNALPGAATYLIKISRDEGASWINYAKNVTEPTKVVNGLYPDMTYYFRIYGVAADGTTLKSYYQSAYTPMSSSEALLNEAFAEYFDSPFEEF